MQQNRKMEQTVDTKATKRQTSQTPPESGQRDEASTSQFIDPAQAMSDLAWELEDVKPASKAELKALLKKKEQTLRAEQASAPLSEGEILSLQEQFPGLSREKAIEMAREFGA